MRFRPLHDGVLLRRIEGEARTSGGIIPFTAKEKPIQGEVNEKRAILGILEGKGTVPAAA